MTFKTISSQKHDGKPDIVRIGSNSRRNKSYSGRISIGVGLMEKLKWDKGDRINVALGMGADRGFVRLMKDSQGAKLTRIGNNQRHACHLILTRLGDRKKHSMEQCYHEIQDGALYIALPDWAVPNE
jgi:hypothetical protein